jgi:L-ascorbate metabolism protein UlaG (beta-lactamase superfamily)
VQKYSAMKNFPSRICYAAAILAVAGCIAVIQQNVQEQTLEDSHHTADGFKNRYIDYPDISRFFRWQLERTLAGLPRPPDQPVVGVAPKIDFLLSNRSEITVTWVGHATLLLQLDGLNILTDPHWGNRASPFSFIGPKRHQPPGIPFEKLPHIDAVLISHNHYDHLDLETVARLMGQLGGPAKFFVPLGVDRWLEKNVPGIVAAGSDQNVWGLDWGDEFKLPGRSNDVVLKFLAVQHWSGRSLFDRYDTLWGSWAVLSPSFRFWFSGDLGYSKDTLDIGEALGRIDLAAIAIGAYEPRWFMSDFHVNPAEAIQVMKNVRAHQAIGIHWGTFENLSDEQLDQPPKDLTQAIQNEGLSADAFQLLKHGETRVWKTTLEASTQ